MNHNKSLLLVVAEWWESRKAHQSSIGGKSIGFWRGFLPTPGNVLFTLLVIGSLLWAQSVGAVSLAAPVVNSSLTIPYQGRLANASGTPFTGNQNMEFRLYNAPSGGTPLWSELWTGGNSVTVNDGLFSVLLGSLTAGLPAVVQGNGQLWLGITVGTDGEMSPRVQLGSAAYSMQALTVPDGSITSAKLADGAVTNSKLARKITRLVATNSIPMPNKNVVYDILSGSINLDVEKLVTIYASAGVQNGVDTLFAVEVKVDGNSVITSHKWQKAGIGEQHMLSTALNLGAGQHTIKLTAFTWENNSEANGDNRTQMVIIEG